MTLLTDAQRDRIATALAAHKSGAVPGATSGIAAMTPQRLQRRRESARLRKKRHRERQKLPPVPDTPEQRAALERLPERWSE